MPRSIRALAAAALAAALPAQHDGVAPPAAQKPAAIDFARDVQPILAQHCFNCHGPDDARRKGELRLDRKLDAFAVREHSTTIVPGAPDTSELFLRITATDADDRMPPTDSGDALKPAQIETLRRWIAEGAVWSEHWAFVPPVRPAVPTIGDPAWPKNDVDRFVLARLQRDGLQPSPEAAREAWLRRVTFDLIGLPPTLAELDAFAKDTAADACEKVVDRLLADPRYGERQASEWLDVARYADSSGYQRDTARQAWKWRDWVIDAFNTNMPFDQFTVEQLAGDLLPKATLSQRIATGFNRNHPVNTEAGEELDEYRSVYVIDRVHTTATTFLGLSVGCAQCHDHKYDPISQREFYGFYDFFNHVKEKDSGFGKNPKPAIAAPGPDDVPRLQDLERRIKSLERRLDREDPLADAEQAAWEATMRERLAAPIVWTPMVPTERMAKHGSRLEAKDDASILATGPVPARDTYELVFMPGKRKIEALRLEVLPDPSLPHGASGRADDGRFILSGLEVRLHSVADSSDPPRVLFATAQADVNQERDDDEHYLTAIEPGSFQQSILVGDGNGPSGGSFRGGGGWSVSGDERKQPREAVLVPIEPLTANETSVLRITLSHGSSSKFKSLIGRFRISTTDDARLRTFLLPLQPSLWRSLGPFPSADVASAYSTEFAVEKDLAAPAWKKKYDQPQLAKDGKPAGGTEAKPMPDASGKPVAATPGADKPKAGNLFDFLAQMAKKPEAPKAAAGEAKATADEADESGEAKGEDAAAAAKQPKKPKARRLEWTEQRNWRDDDSANLAVEGPAVAWYAARKVKCDSPRTMMLELDGGAGARIWLNGNVVAEYAPEPEVPPSAEKPAAKPKEPEEFDEEAFFAMRSGRGGKEPRRLRLGLRAGDNFVVVKLVAKGAAPRPAARSAMPGGMPEGMEQPFDAVAAFEAGELPPEFMQSRPRGGGLSFSCRMKAEGDDLLNYEVLRTLQQTAAPTNPGLGAAGIAPPVVEAALTTKPHVDDDEAHKPKTAAERRQRAVRRWFRTRIDVAGRALFEELERVKAEKQRVESKLPSALVMEELKKRRDTHLFVRGDYRKKGDKVEAMTPAVLPPMAADLPRNRLGLARWLVTKDHPLTARVTVNRAWQQFFGTGIVRTADDFGIRGTAPSHPELLDWLATEFVASGWNVKQLHRLLVLSATYRQASTAPAAAWAKDPDNLLLARGPRQRLSAEMVRDQALFASNLLVQKVGGESVKPFQPEGLWKSMLGSGDWKVDPAEKANRRGLYVYWKRGVPYPSFTIFDAAKRETCTVTRTKTTTPLQALVTLNDPVQVDAGKALGQRMLVEGGADDDAKLRFGFRLVTSRAADDKEVAILKSLLKDQREHFGKHGDDAKKLLGIAEPKGKARGRSGTAGATGSKPEAKPAAMPAPTPTPAPAPAPVAEAPTAAAPPAAKPDAKPPEKPSSEPAPKPSSSKPGAPELPPAERAAWAQIGCTLLNLEAAIRRG